MRVAPLREGGRASRVIRWKTRRVRTGCGVQKNTGAAVAAVSRMTLAPWVDGRGRVVEVEVVEGVGRPLGSFAAEVEKAVKKDMVHGW